MAKNPNQVCESAFNVRIDREKNRVVIDFDRSLAFPIVESLKSCEDGIVEGRQSAAVRAMSYKIVNAMEQLYAIPNTNLSEIEFDLESVN